MKTPQLTVPKFIKPSKTVLLVGAGLLIVVLFTVVGMVASVRADRAEAVQSALERQKQKQAAQRVVELTEQNEALTEALKVQADRTASTCDYIKSFSVKYKLTLPPLCRP